MISLWSSTGNPDMNHAKGAAGNPTTSRYLEKVSILVIALASILQTDETFEESLACLNKPQTLVNTFLI